MATSLLSGMVFGAALTASGVYHPSVILGQLKLADWDMLETFLTATASSTLLISIFHAAGLAKLSPRCYSHLGLFAHYDGNIIGGILLGTGMALAGSCPGTVFAQIGVGIHTGLPTLAGALVAGILWTGLVRPWLRSATPQTPACKEPPKTVHEALGINRYVAAAVFEGLLAAVVAGLTFMSALSRGGPSTRALGPATGGLLIGIAQLASLLLRQSAIGVSAAYEEAGDFLWWPLCTPDTESAQRPKSTSIVFAAGIVVGSWALAMTMPALLEASRGVPVPDIPVWRSALGGFSMVMGARLAGGCTSGHGISGMSLLSVSSFLTIGSALAAGVLAAKLFL